jgi:HD-GYP domain-containing protein (c-di-GMP phosphodiesterase class II)
VFRLLELLGGLSAVTDLGTGSGPDESLRRCLLAVRFARSLGCSDAEVSDVLYVSLLQHLGCTAYASESAAIWGDDIAPTRYAFLADLTDSRDVLRTFVPGVAEATGRSKLRVLGTMAVSGRRMDAEGPPATCEVARDAAGRLGLGPAVTDALYAGLATWDGRGHPRRRGDEIPLATRVMQVASTAVMLLEAGRDVRGGLASRSGSQLDPVLVGAFREDLMEGLGEDDPNREVLDAEPDPVRRVDDADLEAVARTFGDLADLKSPWLHGHCSAVADLAGEAARAVLGAEDGQRTRVAGHLHDLGRVAVSSRLWDKPGPLSSSERDQVELHPYYTERVLARVPMLADVAQIAGRHHERCDGSGYHRGLLASSLSMPARVLAAADRYRCLVEDRPYRPGLDPRNAAATLRDEARAGRLDGDAVAAVLEAAGHRSAGRRQRPADLTERQIDVLRLVASGLSNRAIADRLVISPRTAEHHVQDVYRKTGVTTRAAAALFAMEHGLLGRDG